MCTNSSGVLFCGWSYGQAMRAHTCTLRWLRYFGLISHIRYLSAHAIAIISNTDRHTYVSLSRPKRICVWYGYKLLGGLHALYVYILNKLQFTQVSTRGDYTTTALLYHHAVRIESYATPVMPKLNFHTHCRLFIFIFLKLA